MGNQSKERKKARRRLKKPRKVYTNANANFGAVKAKQGKQPNYNYNMWEGVEKALKRKIKHSVKVPKTITLRINTKKSVLNAYGLPKGITPNTLRTKHKQMIDSLINKGTRPSDVKNIDANWKTLIKAAQYFNQSKKQETKDKWLKKINDLSRNMTLLGFTSSRYVDGNRIISAKGASEETQESQLNRKRFFEAGDDDDFQDERGGFTNAVVLDYEEIDNIISKMGSNWVEAYHKYGRDMRRLINGAGYSMSEYRQHYVNGTPLGDPSMDLSPIKKYED